MKRIIKALSMTQAVDDWLANTHRPRVLHLFDGACNLLNERGGVLSIVTREIGNGPFNLVVEDNVRFAGRLGAESPVFISPDELTLGGITIQTVNVERWNPRPDWEKLHARKERLIPLVWDTFVETANSPSPASLTANFVSALITADMSMAKSSASKLAGLGIGLTPAGDDFLVGALHAVWIILPLEIARELSMEITGIAAPLTTSLSAAWLRSAGKGEAGILWHRFFDALVAGGNVEPPVAKILSVGETSGADALAGFLGVISAFKERIMDECHS